MGPGKTVFRPEIPDSISGIQIQFEVKQVHIIYQGSPTMVFCLCADITNQNISPEKIQIRYQCQGKEKVRYIEIGGRQQKIILVDKWIRTKDSQVSRSHYFSHITLEYNQGARY